MANNALGASAVESKDPISVQTWLDDVVSVAPGSTPASSNVGNQYRPAPSVVNSVWTAPPARVFDVGYIPNDWELTDLVSR